MLEDYRSGYEGFGRFCGQDAVDVSLKRSVGQCAESACKCSAGAQIRWVSLGLGGMVLRLRSARYEVPQQDRML